MKIKLNKKDQQTVIKKLDSIEDLKLHAVVQTLQGGEGPGGPYNQFTQTWTQWTVFHRIIEPDIPTGNGL